MSDRAFRDDLARVIFLEFAKNDSLRALAVRDYIRGQQGGESIANYLGRVLSESAVIYADQFVKAIEREDLQ